MRACIAVALLALAACGSDHSKADASIIIPDTAIDAKVWMDAPPSTYDFSCFGGTAPTTATDPITIAGTTQALSQGGGTPVENVDVAVFKTGSATVLGSDTTDATGAFATGNITTNAMPLNGYVRATDANTQLMYRTTYMYPPTVVTASLTDVPVLMLSNATFDQIASALGGQDDTMNGALFFAITDCTSVSGGLTNQTLVAEATVDVQQSGTNVGTKLGLDVLDPSLAGIYVVLNVPDGPTDIIAKYQSMTFPTRTVVAHKQPNGQNTEGTLTVTAVRPGP